MKLKSARRIKVVPPYLFARIDAVREQMIRRGIDVIDLSVGDPDEPTPPYIRRAMHRAVDNPVNHHYPPYTGTPKFREAVVGWYRKRFGVKLDPEKEVIALIGSKEGIAHLIFGWIDPGDVALVPDPGYPVYGTCVTLAGGRPIFVPLRADRNFIPDLNSIPSSMARKARLLFLNYPNNPTGAVATQEFFGAAVQFARRNSILICSDLAYSEMTYGGYRAPSILQIPGAKDVAIEFHTLSKTYNMTGWRMGMAVGNPEAIRALSIIKTNVDSGQFMAIQEAATAALRGPTFPIRAQAKIYERRMKWVVDALNSMGWDLPTPRGSFYVWAPVPKGETSEEFCTKLLEKAGVLVVPGNGYGKNGEGYFRISITVPDKKLQEAFRNIRKALAR